MRPRVMLVIVVILCLFALINLYIGWHIQLFLGSVLHIENFLYFWVLFGLIVFSYILARLGSRYLPYWLSGLLKQIGAYWLAIMFFCFLLLPFADAAAVGLALLGVESPRSIVLLGSLLSLLVLILMLRGFWNASNPIVRSYELTVPKGAGKLDKLRVAVASDLHLGSIVGNKKLRLLVDRMNALKPDLILLPGDIIDDDIQPFIRHKMGDIMKQLQAPLGIYAVLGNHEYIGGHVPQFVEQMNIHGIKVLMDQSVFVADSFYVIGRKDKAAESMGSQGRMPLTHLLSDLDPAFPFILMDHQPHRLDLAEAAGVDVMLSGHTHRGQIMPNHYITRKLFELDWGYLKKGSLHAIVSSGYGTWGPPIRIGSRSEIIELVVTFEAAH